MNERAPRALSRTVPLGAALIAFGVVQFTLAMAVVQSEYPGYSDFANYISDLGNTATSPGFVVFNVSIILLGLLAFVGVLLAWEGFPRGGSRGAGLPLVLLASIAAVLVGCFPENVSPPVHDVVSLLVFAPGGVALVVLAAGMHQRTGWDWLLYAFGGARAGDAHLAGLLCADPVQQFNVGPRLGRAIHRRPILIWGLLAAIQLGRQARVPSLDRRLGE